MLTLSYLLLLFARDKKAWESRSALATGTHRFDVTMQETNRVDALNGLQDLAAQAQGGADAEGPADHAPSQVGQVSTLLGRKRQHGQFRCPLFKR